MFKMIEYKRNKPHRYPQELMCVCCVEWLHKDCWTIGHHLAEALHLLSELHSGHKYTEHQVYLITHHILMAWEKSK